MMVGRRYVPPAPGMMPRRVSGRARRAFEEITRRCVHSANSRPPPRAVPEMAEMVGMGRVERRVNVERRRARKRATLWLGGCC